MTLTVIQNVISLALSISQNANTISVNPVVIVSESTQFNESDPIFQQWLSTNPLGGLEPAFSKNTAFNKDFGTAANTVTQGNDSRLSDARTPLAHTHVEADITDLDKYTKVETDNLLGNKLDKVSTAGVERAYIINADGSQGTKATSEFKDVLEFANLAALPATGEVSKIYITIDTNLQYRWSGSSYVQIGGSIEKNTNLNTTITGTTVETLLYTKNIGVITTNNLLKIEDLLVTQNYDSGIVNASGNIILRIRISDSPTLPTDVNSIIATLSIPSNTSTFDSFAKMERTFTFMPLLGSETQYTIICPPPNGSFNTDIINSFGYKWNVFGQLTNSKYLFITAELPFSTNKCTLRSLIIQKI